MMAAARREARVILRFYHGSPRVSRLRTSLAARRVTRFVPRCRAVRVRHLSYGCVARTRVAVSPVVLCGVQGDIATSVLIPQCVAAVRGHVNHFGMPVSIVAAAVAVTITVPVSIATAPIRVMPPVA